MNDFAVFIITHDRAERQSSLDCLLRMGYTGQYWLVVDNEDPSINRYLDLYPNNILVFNKADFMENTDIGSRRTEACATFARNAVECLALKLGYQFFLVMDDDITDFRFRYDEDDSLKSFKVKTSLDDIFSAYVEFLRTTGVSTVSFGVAKTFIGGVSSLANDKIAGLRECYTMFFRNNRYRVDWVSAVYEDIITSSLSGKKGQVWLQLPFVQLDTVAMVENSGGNTSMYKAFQQFEYPFHSVMYMPGTMSIVYKNNKYLGVISKKHDVPMIISNIYQKTS